MHLLKMNLFVLTLAVFLAAPLSADTKMDATTDQQVSWLPTLQTSTPQEGFELAVKLARVGVKTTQPDMDVLHRERKSYAQDGNSLIRVSEVIAVHFQTISAANNYWK